jgi:hypothetical protein
MNKISREGEDVFPVFINISKASNPITIKTLRF